MEYKLRCCNYLGYDLYYFQITSTDSRYATFFSCYSDGSGIGTANGKYLKLADLPIIYKLLTDTPAIIKKEIRKFNKLQKSVPA